MVASENTEADAGPARTEEELPVPETLQAFTRDQIKALIAYFSDKHGDKFSTSELGEKYRILERYLHSLAGDKEQYDKFLEDFRLWKNKQQNAKKPLLDETNPIESEPSIDSVLKITQVNETWSIGGYHSENTKSGKEMTQLFDGDRKARSFKTMRDMKNVDSLASDVMQLLYSGMFDPVLGKAARPKKLMLKSPELVDKLKEKLNKLEIEIVYNLQDNQDVSTVPLAERYSCYSCGLTCSKNALKKCSGCHAVYYCSTDCFKRDWRKKPVEASHKTWCPEFKLFEQTLFSKYKELFPFTSADETSNEQFVIADFLHRNKVLGLGYWQTLLAACNKCDNETCANDDHAMHPHKTPEVNDDDIETPYIDPSLAKLERLEAYDKSQQFKSWSEFYEARSLDLASPVASVLSTCLTIRYISRVLFPMLINDNSKTLHIVLLESEYNPKAAGLFKQLLFKEHALKIKLTIYQSKFNSFKIQYKPENFENETSLIVDIKQSRFPIETIKSSERPDLVIGFNCFDMVERPENAMKIIKALLQESIPIYFVNFCPMFTSMQQSWLKQVMEHEKMAEDVRISKPAINPFASPLRLKNSSFTFPWFQNGLLYYVSKD